MLEEQLYEQVVVELSNGKKRDGLWAKAISNSSGVEEKAKALYIKYRVQSIKDEIEVSKEIQAEENYQAQNAGAIEERRLEKERVLAQQRKLSVLKNVLASKGYVLNVKGSGWSVSEPLGGQQRIATIEDLEEYANSR